MSQLRTDTAVYYDEILHRYFVTGYHEASKLLRRTDLSHDLRRAEPGTASHQLLRKLGASNLALLFQDPPRHGELRSSISGIFTPRHVETRWSEIRDLADRILQGLHAQGGFDVIADYIAPLTTQVIAEFVGIRPADWKHYRHLTRLDNQAFDIRVSASELQEATQARAKLRQILGATIEERRSDPRDDVISTMIRSPYAFSDHEIAITVQFILRAGNLTATDLIGNIVHALIQNPMQLSMLRTSPNLVAEAVEEALRYDTAALEAGRIVTSRITVGSTAIDAGQTLMISLASANRDSHRFPNCDVFDITRSDKLHLSFGGGLHYCLGAALVRLEARLAIEALLDRYSSLSLDVGNPAQRQRFPSFRGFAVLPVLCQT